VPSLDYDFVTVDQAELFSPAATAELLKAGSGSVQPTGSMGVGRYFHAATSLPDGRVLITGGIVGPNLTSHANG
jgi:hypothetical protein